MPHLAIQRGSFSLDVDLSLPSSGVNVIFGQSGSGKSSLLRALAGLDGHSACAPSIGYLPQDNHLFPHLSVKQNILFGRPKCAPNDADDMVERLGLQTLLTHKPHQLSGGQARRVALARALITQPQQLLLDEPFAGQDSEHKAAMAELIQDHVANGSQCLMVTHDINDVLQLGERIAFIQYRTFHDFQLIEEALLESTFPWKDHAQTSTILSVQQANFDADNRISHLDTDAGTLKVAGTVHSHARRVRILAKDISITTAMPQSSSILNILPATIETTRTLSEDQVELRLRTQNAALLAHISHYSYKMLKLQLGMSVIAQVKGVALLA